MFAVAGLAAGGLAACSDDDDGGAPAAANLSPSATATPTATRSAPAPNASAAVGPIPKAGTPLGPKGNSIKVGNMAAGGSDEQAVLRAYLKFWVERAKALRLAKVNKTALAKVAVDEAAAGVVQNVADLARGRQHAEGGSTVNVTEVKIEGENATLKDCFEDRSVVVASDGEKVDPPPGVTVTSYTVTLRRDGDRWRVTKLVKVTGPTCAP